MRKGPNSGILAPQVYLALVASGFLGACFPPPPTPGPVYGYLIDCDPSDTEDDLVCMQKPQWNCELHDHYVPEALCAFVNGGTPSDYKDKPEIVKPAWNDNQPLYECGVPHEIPPLSA
jgi:hypothetical protein